MHPEIFLYVSFTSFNSNFLYSVLRHNRSKIWPRKPERSFYFCSIPYKPVCSTKLFSENQFLFTSVGKHFARTRHDHAHVTSACTLQHRHNFSEIRQSWRTCVNKPTENSNSNSHAISTLLFNNYGKEKVTTSSPATCHGATSLSSNMLWHINSFQEHLTGYQPF